MTFSTDDTIIFSRFSITLTHTYADEPSIELSEYSLQILAIQLSGTRTRQQLEVEMRMQCNWPPGWQSSHRCYCCGFHLASLLRPVRYYYEQRNLSLAPSDADSWLFSLPTARVLLSSSHEWRCGVFLTQPFPKRNFYFSRSQGFGHIFLSLFQDLSQVSWTTCCVS